MNRILLFAILILSSASLFAQDTIRFMHYNLLNYRNTTGQCTNSTNNADKKDGHLQTIVEHVVPDILTVNEMGANWLNPNKILTNALNKNGRSFYDQAEFKNNSFSSLTNMLFFNSNKLELYKQDVIAKSVNNVDLVRVIDVYTLYVKNTAVTTGDTTFLTVFVAHLKAGSASSDKEQRADMTEAAMEFLKANHSTSNYFFAGDFNIQTSSEKCYQNLIQNSETSIRFYDVKDAPGSWNNNSLYSNLHTQSTHDGDSRGGCFSTGGMDDRFDIILCGNEVLKNTNGVKYIDGSYKALGQDSRRFNGNILNPSSNIIPASVSNALYEMSDHLPVLMDVVAKDGSASVTNVKNNRLFVSHKEDTWEVYLPKENSQLQIAVYDLTGKKLVLDMQDMEGKLVINHNSIPSGVYLIVAENANGNKYFQKVTK